MPDNITKTEAAAFIPEIWSQEVIRATNPKFVLANLVWRFDKDAKMGDTIKVPSVSNLVANDKVANVPVAKQKPTETNTDILVNIHKEVSYEVEDIAELQANRNLRQLYTEPASTAIADAVDTSLAELGASLSQTKGTYNTAVTTDVILDSIEILDLNDVPESDRYFAFRADVKRDLLDLAAYTSSDFVDGRPVQTGMIGSLYGVQTFMSNNLVISGSNTNNMLFHKEAFALAMAQAPRAQAEYSLQDLAWLAVIDAVYGVKEMRDSFGVLIKS